MICQLLLYDLINYIIEGELGQNIDDPRLTLVIFFPNDRRPTFYSVSQVRPNGISVGFMI